MTQALAGTPGFIIPIVCSTQTMSVVHLRSADQSKFLISAAINVRDLNGTVLLSTGEWRRWDGVDVHSTADLDGDGVSDLGVTQLRELERHPDLVLPLRRRLHLQLVLEQRFMEGGTNIDGMHPRRSGGFNRIDGRYAFF